MANFNKEIEELTRSIIKTPESYVFYRDRAWIYFKNNQIKEAIQDMDKAIECNPSDPELYSRRATILKHGNLYDAAEKDQAMIDELLVGMEK